MEIILQNMVSSEHESRVIEDDDLQELFRKVSNFYLCNLWIHANVKQGFLLACNNIHNTETPVIEHIESHLTC